MIMSIDSEGIVVLLFLFSTILILSILSTIISRLLKLRNTDRDMIKFMGYEPFRYQNGYLLTKREMRQHYRYIQKHQKNAHLDINQLDDEEFGDQLDQYFEG